MTLPGVIFAVLVVGGCILGIALWEWSSRREERKQAFLRRLPSLACPVCRASFGELSPNDRSPAFLDSKDWFYHDRSQWPDSHREQSLDEITEVRCPNCRSITLFHCDGTVLETKEAPNQAVEG